MSPDEREQLLLWGFMGTGKSSVGARLAERRGALFCDLDARIEETSGKTIAEIFATEGEAAFRRREAEALERLFEERAFRVVALGGGALLDERLRKRALAEAFVVVLEAAPEAILARVTGSARPLLRVDHPGAEIVRLLAIRRAAYDEAHARVESNRPIAEVVELVDGIWRHR